MDAKEKLMPFKHYLVSFDKLLKVYEQQLNSEDTFLAATAQRILDAQKGHPILRDGFTDFSLLEKYQDVIDIILQDTFTQALGSNEIKVATLPYKDIIIKSSNRFQSIVKNAGENYEPEMRNPVEGMDYIMSCVVILNFYYGFNIDFGRPFFYDIPDAKGVMHHYRILYNGECIVIYPTEKTKEISHDDLDDLLDNPYAMSLIHILHCLRSYTDLLFHSSS